MKSKMLGFAMLCGLLTVGQAQALVFENLTYPEQSINALCQDQACEVIKITISQADGSTQERYASREVITKTALNRRSYKTRGFIHHKAYGWTQDLAAKTKKRYKEAYYGKSVANAVLTPVAATAETVYETALLPLRGVEAILSKRKRDSREDRKGAAFFLANLDSDIEKVVVKEKYYRRMMNYLSSVSYKHVDIIDGTYTDVIQAFINNTYNNCYVLSNVEGYNQVYVNGNFSGNYIMGSEDDDLGRRLLRLLDLRVCKEN